MSKKKQDEAEAPLTWDDENAPIDEAPAPKRARKLRLQPVELIPTATITNNDGVFAVRLRTGRQAETLDPDAAHNRANALEFAAASIRRVAEKVAAVNEIGD